MVTLCTGLSHSFLRFSSDGEPISNSPAGRSWRSISSIPIEVLSELSDELLIDLLIELLTEILLERLTELLIELSIEPLDKGGSISSGSLQSSGKILSEISILTISINN